MGFIFILSILSNRCELCFTTVTSKNSTIKQSTKPISIGMDEFRNLSLKESPDTAGNNQSSPHSTPIKVTHIFTTQTYISLPVSRGKVRTRAQICALVLTFHSIYIFYI